MPDMRGPGVHPLAGFGRYGAAMIRFLLPLVLLVACAGGSQAVWLRPGTGTGQVDQDLVACQRRAQFHFPERLRIGSAPDVTIGGSGCRHTRCTGLDDTPEIFDFDANSGPRARAVSACMALRGHRLVPLPGCRDDAVRPLARQPADTRGLCVAQGHIAVP